MKNKHIVIVLLLVFFSLNSAQVFASRAFPPAKISPVIYKNIKIVAENNSPSNMGVVQAFDVNSNKPIWSKQVYEVKMNSHVEADTQWVFIKDMKIDGDKLVVTNEKQKIYELDPFTGESLQKSNLTTVLYIGVPIVVIVLGFIILMENRRLVS